MNVTVGGEDNPALDVESRKAAELARISEDTTTKKKVVAVSRKQNVFEMTTIERNELAAKTEQAINPNKLSDAMMLQRSLYFMGGGAVISMLIATTALVLVLIVMSQSPPTKLTDAGTVHARSPSSPIDQGIQNLMKSLQKAQIELENIWMAINSTARKTSNLASKVFHMGQLNEGREHKLREETNSLKILIESLKVQLQGQSLLSQENKTKDLAVRLELTQRELKSLKVQLTVRTVALWSSQNSTMAELDKLKSVWTAINTTVQKTSNLTNKIGDEIQTVWLNLNQSKKYSRTLTNYIKSFKENLNQSIALLQSSDASLFVSLVGINATIAEKVNNVSKMMGPIGPRGFNGSQGPPGPMGSIGPAGPNGTGDLSTCQYKTKKAVETAGDPLTTIALHEPFGKRVIGATCSANYGAENNLLSRFHNNIRQYACHCRQTDTRINPPSGEKRTCFLHYWQCPLTT